MKRKPRCPNCLSGDRLNTDQICVVCLEGSNAACVSFLKDSGLGHLVSGPAESIVSPAERRARFKIIDGGGK